MTDEVNNIPETDESTDNTAPEQVPAQEPDQENETEILKAQVKEANYKFLRLYAEFDNYKRRTMKEKSEILQTAGKEIILSLLPVIDDFERARKAAATTSDLEAYRQGIDLVHQKFNSILLAKGLKDIESAGQEFNVDLHEAITNIPAPSEDLKGKVVDEVEKGYTLNGHVIRFAKVVVGE